MLKAFGTTILSFEEHYTAINPVLLKDQFCLILWYRCKVNIQKINKVNIYSSPLGAQKGCNTNHCA